MLIGIVIDLQVKELLAAGRQDLLYAIQLHKRPRLAER
jgi:hypothetical protein